MKNLEQKLEDWDEKMIHHTKRLALPFSRFAIFIVYFWFGALKVFGNSPASPLVTKLLNETLPGVTPASFLIVFGVFEMVIGLVFIIPHLQRLGIFVLGIHLIMTIMPLFILPDVTWQGFLTPTLEGQYIIKNILIVALVIGIFAHLRPLEEKSFKRN